MAYYRAKRILQIDMALNQLTELIESLSQWLDLTKWTLPNSPGLLKRELIRAVETALTSPKERELSVVGKRPFFGGTTRDLGVACGA